MNTSLAAPGALIHRLQCLQRHTASDTAPASNPIWPSGAPKWPTGSVFCKIEFFFEKKTQQRKWVGGRGEEGKRGEREIMTVTTFVIASWRPKWRPTGSLAAHCSCQYFDNGIGFLWHKWISWKRFCQAQFHLASSVTVASVKPPTHSLWKGILAFFWTCYCTFICCFMALPT